MIPKMNLKGIVGCGSNLFFSHKGFLIPPHYACEFFELKYIPPSHFLSLFKKTHPVSIAYRFRSGNVICNIPVEKIENQNPRQRNSILTKLTKYFQSCNPMNYAALRLKARRFVNRALKKHLMRCSVGARTKLTTTERAQLVEVDSNLDEAFSRLREEDFDPKFSGVLMFRFDKVPSPENKRDYFYKLGHAIQTLKNKDFDRLRGFQNAVKASNGAARSSVAEIVSMVVLGQFVGNPYGIPFEIIGLLKNNIVREQDVVKEMLKAIKDKKGLRELDEMVTKVELEKLSQRSS